MPSVEAKRQAAMRALNAYAKRQIEYRVKPTNANKRKMQTALKKYQRLDQAHHKADVRMRVAQANARAAKIKRGRKK